MIDLGHVRTDDDLNDLIEFIKKIYSDALDTMTEECRDYWNNFIEREETMRGYLDAGQITQAQFDAWRIAQIGRGENLDAIADNIANTLANAKEIVADATNEELQFIYSLNRNWSAYTIESALDQIPQAFTLIDRNTLRRLLIEQPDLLPYYDEYNLMALVRGLTNEDIAYCKRKVFEGVTSGIIRGEAVQTIARETMQKVVTMEYNSAIRACRTAFTSAENAGRLDNYEESARMGMPVKKEWMCTHDFRTRTSHAQLDGKIVDYDKKFPNGLMYPADPSGRPEEVYNCRCTMVAVLPKTSRHYRQTFDQWQEQKVNELGGERAYHIEETKVRNRNRDRETYYSLPASERRTMSFAEYQSKKYGG